MKMKIFIDCRGVVVGWGGRVIQTDINVLVSNRCLQWGLLLLSLLSLLLLLLLSLLLLLLVVSWTVTDGSIVAGVESKGLEKWFVTRSVIQLRRSPPSSMLDKNRESKQLKSRQRRKEKYTYTSIDKLRLERQQHSKPKCNIIYTKIQLTALWEWKTTLINAQTLDF